jgi:hypothetical protein
MVVRAEDIDGQPYVAICPNRGDGAHEADARLIAAAPAFYAALAELVAAARACDPHRIVEAVHAAEGVLRPIDGEADDD